MLDVRATLRIHEDICDACDMHIKQKVKGIRDKFVEDIINSDDVLQSVIDYIKNDMTVWYHVTTTNRIVSTYHRYDPDQFISKDWRDEIRRLVDVVFVKEAALRDKYLDLLYSRPTDEEVEEIRQYIESSHYEIECSK